MKLATIHSRAVIGITAPLVTVEVHLSPGLPGLHIVGLPETTVKESKERVRSAIMNSQFNFPSQRVTINLGPADLPKEGGRFDLAIALGILVASNQLPNEIVQQFEFVGELALSGKLRAVKAILPVLLAARKAQRSLIIPRQHEHSLIVPNGCDVRLASSLLEVAAFLKQETELLKHNTNQPNCSNEFTDADLGDVKGQFHAKRALQIAATGRHSMLMIGPPGTGKTMLAARLPGILPNLDEEQAFEVASIASLTQHGFEVHRWRQVPFRAPHHSTSGIALIGGGRPPKPGEISLAHRGVLFLDELPEFKRHALECLREPLETRQVTISRASYQMTFPANFQLIAAMNPCPCGFAGLPSGECQCSELQIRKYLQKISGPLLDRIDIQVTVNRLSSAVLGEALGHTQESLNVKSAVLVARERQLRRQGKCNNELTGPELDEYCPIQPEVRALIDKLMNKINFSPRVYHRLLKVARSIADYENCQLIQQNHMAEAVQYRFLDYKNVVI